MLLTNGFRILCLNLFLGEFLVNRQAVMRTEPSVEVLGPSKAVLGSSEASVPLDVQYRPSERV